jgi:hypothetical protein
LNIRHSFVIHHLAFVISLRAPEVTQKAVVILKSLLILPARRFRVVTICAPGPALRGRISE